MYHYEDQNFQVIITRPHPSYITKMQVFGNQKLSI